MRRQAAFAFKRQIQLPRRAKLSYGKQPDFHHLFDIIGSAAENVTSRFGVTVLFALSCVRGLHDPRLHGRTPADCSSTGWRSAAPTVGS